ncbi:ester cyclase [Pseudonocardia hydrocarbonoxydans]|uniref:Ester cyclase n=1 Tax=Pseudonocardia hydrocarbonoxydans TaxID=76726 RepID=A0A4Y3WVK8_9PSEU|nr:ester cyclase [Pseudonocardia hydrocarbonoxydans]GEC21759.1 hypothetical protein PHY01_40420 [Pseudonocardia hydrocarbonoxydans]
MNANVTTIATAVGMLNDGDVDGYVTTLYAPDAAVHGFPPDFPPTRDGIGAFMRTLRAGVPDVRITAQDIVADGDRVAVRFTVTGTHTGEVFGNPGTGAAIDAEGITIVEFRDGQVVERWNRLDEVALHTQIGAIPAPA